MNAKAWIQAARLRTLPLAVSGILVGAGVARKHFPPNVSGRTPQWHPQGWTVFGLLLLTAVLLQVLSNFANDYGDFVKGTDNADRVGPERTLQSGALTPRAMRVGLWATGLLALASGTSALVMRFGDAVFSTQALLFLGLGLLAVWAAVQYTVGKRAYGYHGLGDAFVFVFFGLVAVGGTAVLLTQDGTLDGLWWRGLLPAVAVGCFSTAVLNLNNMRDIENDAASGKRTLVVKMGLTNAKTYHGALLLLAWLSVVVLYLLREVDRQWNVLWFVPLLLMAGHLKFAMGNSEPRAFDPELKKVALATFVFALIFFGTALP